MPKPDKVLRNRPLKEVPAALAQLKRVVLFHSRPIVQQVPTKYCVCRKGDTLPGETQTKMIQCAHCLDWFHFKCLGFSNDKDVADDIMKCEWCKSEVDRLGYQRWRLGRKIPKRRHFQDTPRNLGCTPGGDLPPQYSAPTSWEGKVAEIQEQARRAAIKKRKLQEAVEKLIDEGGHHLVDAEGMAGLELRSIDDALVDDFVVAGLVDPEEADDDDDELAPEEAVP